jgi:hypothetical protein
VNVGYSNALSAANASFTRGQAALTNFSATFTNQPTYPFSARFPVTCSIGTTLTARNIDCASASLSGSVRSYALTVQSPAPGSTGTSTCTVELGLTGPGTCQFGAPSSDAVILVPPDPPQDVLRVVAVGTVSQSSFGHARRRVEGGGGGGDDDDNDPPSS